MPDKVIGSPDEAMGCPLPRVPHTPASTARPKTRRQDDGITNPRDGRGPLRPRDDQAAKLPLRPPH